VLEDEAVLDEGLGSVAALDEGSAEVAPRARPRVQVSVLGRLVGVTVLAMGCIIRVGLAGSVVRFEIMDCRVGVGQFGVEEAIKGIAVLCEQSGVRQRACDGPWVGSNSRRLAKIGLRFARLGGKARATARGGGRHGLTGIHGVH
jgi:hypothetical protein